jgi:hypothetical protein
MQCRAVAAALRPTFGMIQLRVPRDVTNIISDGDLPFVRYGKAAY